MGLEPIRSAWKAGSLPVNLYMHHPPAHSCTGTVLRLTHSNKTFLCH